MAEERKRVRRSAEQKRADDIAQVEAKIHSYEEKISALKEQLEELKRPRPLSDAEKQLLLKQKIQDGLLSVEEAYQLGYNI